MKIIIVTGMSGAGKSTALNVLEDEGYYCVDNMPISLMPKFAELADGHNQDKGYNNIALGIDIRSGHSLAELDSVLDYMKEKKYEYTIVFLESSDEVLIKRYKETRRAHPLAKDGRVDKAIMLEREQLKFLKQRADVIIDTSQLLTREFKEELEKIVLGRKEFNNLMVTVLSFGFKYGIPSDADIVFDVRFLPNPYYVEELRPLTGNDKKIQDYVMKALSLRYDFIANRLLAASRRFSTAQIRRAVELCAETDYAMKSSRTEPTELLKECIMRIAAGEEHA